VCADQQNQSAAKRLPKPDWNFIANTMLKF